jgi:hypothetical protein
MLGVAAVTATMFPTGIPLAYAAAALSSRGAGPGILLHTLAAI